MKVKIDESESTYVERLFFEYEAGKSNIAFLMTQEDINYDVLQDYINVVETRYVELEKAKEELTNTYAPKSFRDKEYIYEFLFDENAIEYTERN